jgi:hypothetical protein
LAANRHDSGAVISDISDLMNVLANEVTNIVYPEMRFDEGGATWDKTAVYDTPASTAPVAVNQFDTGKQFNTGAKFDEKKAPTISGTPVVIYPGWPSSDNLAKALAAGITHITIFPQAQERNTTRYQERELVVTPPAPTLALTIGGPALLPGQIAYDAPGVTWDLGDYDVALQRSYSVTVGGTVTSPQNVALKINGKFYAYAVQPKDTVAGIASALGALVAADIAETSVNGAVITIGPTGRLQAARVGGFGTVAREVKRQERVMSIITWANSPALRDQIAGAVDACLADRRFVCMPDGFGARIIYKNSMVIDAQQKAALYRRDLNYLVEYATTISEQQAAVIMPSASFNSFTINI